MEDDVSDTGVVCAVDLGGTNLRAANIDLNGRIHERFRTPTPKSDNAEEIVSAIAAAVRECEARAQERGAQVQAVSVVLPGSIQAHTRVVVNAPNLACLQGFQLAEALKAELDRSVLIENDANAAALGE